MLNLKWDSYCLFSEKEILEISNLIYDIEKESFEILKILNKQEKKHWFIYRFLRSYFFNRKSKFHIYVTYYYGNKQRVLSYYFLIPFSAKFKISKKKKRLVNICYDINKNKFFHNKKTYNKNEAIAYFTNLGVKNVRI
jgi:hypothetical protein